MIITDFLERNARLYGGECALVEINPSEERDKAVTWWDFNLIESASDAPYRRELSWKDFDRRANRFANLLLSRGLKKGTKVAILLMTSDATKLLETAEQIYGVYRVLLKPDKIATKLKMSYNIYCPDFDLEHAIPEWEGEMSERTEQVIRQAVEENGVAYVCEKIMEKTQIM